MRVDRGDILMNTKWRNFTGSGCPIIIGVHFIKVYRIKSIWLSYQVKQINEPDAAGVDSIEHVVHSKRYSITKRFHLYLLHFSRIDYLDC